MYSKLRSLIFKLDPENAHDLAIKSLKFNIFKNKKNIKSSLLQTKIFGKTIPNPIGLAAGFDKDAEIYNGIFNLGFGFVEVGTITPNGQYGNPKPRVFRLEEDEALINRLGFNNSGSVKVRERIISNSPKGLFGINIGPNKNSNDRIKDYLIGIQKFYDLADYLTINISSPNTENLRTLHKENELDKLLSKINEEKEKLNTKTPLVLKISPDIKDENIADIANLTNKYNIDALIISNTTDKNRESLININKLEKGGLSGKPLEEQSNKLINKFYKILDKRIKIIGVGGIDSGNSVYKKFINGASLVQLYTGLVYKGPNIVNQISEELINILNNKKIKNISEIVGLEK